ncbi:MAG: hypothetical protein MJZ49_04525 [Bacteroidales bacterium]|nr:hypothetical protein [Bacteroidales bacterium]
MRKTIFATILVLALICTACANFYQVFQVAGYEKYTADNHGMRYEDGDCIITYDFWRNHGTLSFDLYNKSNQTMHIYLGESFIINNKHAKDFEQLKVTDRNQNFSDKIVSIPPGAFRHFTCPEIRHNIFEFCNIEVCPSPDLIQISEFTKDDSPLNFGMFLTYTLGQNESKKMVKNNFYVNQVVNYHKRNFEQTHDDTLRICNEEEVIEIQDLRSPDKFFIEY